MHGSEPGPEEVTFRMLVVQEMSIFRTSLNAADNIGSLVLSCAYSSLYLKHLYQDLYQHLKQIWGATLYVI